MCLLDFLARSGPWLLLAFCGAQALTLLGLALWWVWGGAVRPRLIPAADIDRAAAEIIADSRDPEAEASARHEAAWERSDGAAQVYWFRVRRAVARRLGVKRTGRW